MYIVMGFCKHKCFIKANVLVSVNGTENFIKFFSFTYCFFYDSARMSNAVVRHFNFGISSKMKGSIF